MSEKKEWPRLGPMELVWALRCCTKAPGDLEGCHVCPMRELRGKMETDCFDEIIIQAAQMIRQMTDATENICQRQETEMIRLAKEMDVSLERGLIGTNKGQFEELLQCQKVLTELGWESMIRTVPVEPEGWKVLGIGVQDRTIFGEIEQEIAASPVAPQNDEDDLKAGDGDGPGG